MRIGGLAGLIALAVGGSAIAAKPVAPIPSVISLDMKDAKCTIDAASNEAVVDQLKAESRLADHQLTTTAKFQALIDSHPWKENVAMGEQMTPTEANTFGNLQEQMRVGTLSMLLESKRSRDLMVFIEMADIAKRMKGDYQLPKDENSEEYLLAVLLNVGREKYALDPASETRLLSRTGKCDFENALIAGAGAALVSAQNVPGADRAGTDITTLAAKYGKPIDRAKLDEDEKLIFDRSRAVVTAAIGRENYAKDLLFVARLEAVSAIQQSVRRQSQFEAPGDQDHLKAVWEEWRSGGKITTAQNDLSAILNYISEKIPTNFAKDLDSLQPNTNAEVSHRPSG